MAIACRRVGSFAEAEWLLLAVVWAVHDGYCHSPKIGYLYDGGEIMSCETL